ncbi:MAG TPA: hypothetical protein PK904_15160 [Bacteroidales bacterium]|nr:hypothetical protein [Bacteroidales bacterium]
MNRNKTEYKSFAILRELFIVTMLISVFSASMFAQKKVEIIPDVIEALPGSEILVPIVVTGFDTDTSSVAAIEFYIDFDNTVLTYIEPVNFNELFPEVEWFYSNPSPELSRFACNWAEPGLLNVNIPDGTVLFEIRLLYNGGESILDFDESRSIFVHIDQNFNLFELQVDYFNGFVTYESSEFETYWNGVGPWNDNSFWSNGVPTPNSVAIIETGEAIVETGIASVKELLIELNASIKILPNRGLTIDTLLTNNGLIWISSDESGTGSLIVKNLTEGNGNYKIERYLSNGFHTIGAPIANNSSNIFQDNQLSRWNEPTAQFINHMGGTLMGSGWGYLAEIGSDATFVFEGNSIHQGDIELSLSNSFTGDTEFQGVNLVSNPYPSAISWDIGNWDLNNTGKAIYIWDNDKYRVWNGYIGNIENGIIPEMQGFLVKGYDQNPSLKIPNDARIHSNQPFYKEVKEVDRLLEIEFGKFINNEFGPVEDVVYFQAAADATNEFDPELDAFKLPNASGTTMAYSILNEANNEKMAIDVRGWDGASIPSVSIGFRPSTSGKYYLRLSNATSFDPAIPIVLEDKLNLSPFPGNQVDMRTGVFNFTYLFDASTSDEEERFIIHFSPVGIEENDFNKDYSMQVIEDHLVVNHLGGIPENALLQLFDQSGRLLMTQRFYIDEMAIIDISQLSGLILLRLQTETVVLTEKIIKLN